MHPTSEQKAFLRTHAITRCPPAPAIGMFWTGNHEATEEDMLKSLGTMPELITLSQKFELDKMRREKGVRRLRRFHRWAR